MDRRVLDGFIVALVATVGATVPLLLHDGTSRSPFDGYRYGLDWIVVSPPVRTAPEGVACAVRAHGLTDADGTPIPREVRDTPERAAVAGLLDRGALAVIGGDGGGHPTIRSSPAERPPRALFEEASIGPVDGSWDGRMLIPPGDAPLPLVRDEGGQEPAGPPATVMVPAFYASSSVRHAALVGVLPDGQTRMSTSLAVLAILHGAEGPASVDEEAVRIADTLEIAAPNGWLAMLPGGLESGWRVRTVAPECPLVTGPGFFDDGRPTVDPAGRVVLVTNETTAGLRDTFGDVRPDPIDLILLEIALAPSDIRAVEGSRALTVAWMLPATLAIALVARRRQLLGLLIMVFVLIGLSQNAMLSTSFGSPFHLLPILLAALLSYVAATGLNVMSRRRRQRELVRLVTEHVPRELTGELIPGRSDEPMVTGEREATVVFCDLRGYTPVAAEMSSADVERMLRIFYEHVGDRVLENGGTLVQYVGDEVFATFGPPAVVDDHAERALNCARALRDDRGELAERLAEAGFVPMEYGIGLHTGTVVTAEVTGHGLRQYSVIGDAVNVGSRLTTAAGAGEVLFSGEVFSRVPTPPTASELAEVELKGVSRPLKIYRLD